MSERSSGLVRLFSGMAANLLFTGVIVRLFSGPSLLFELRFCLGPKRGSPLNLGMGFGGFPEEATKKSEDVKGSTPFCPPA
jgi:hypothetical protein